MPLPCLLHLTLYVYLLGYTGRQLRMHRTRSLVAGLLPLIPGAAPERLAVWLVKGYVQNSSARAPLAALNIRQYSAAPPPPTQAAAEPFLNGSSSVYVEEMYNSWLQDPKSVHAVSTKENFILFAKNFS